MRRKILREGKYYEKKSIMTREVCITRRKLSREKKYIVREIKKYYEEICDKNGLPECNWNQTPTKRLVI